MCRCVESRAQDQSDSCRIVSISASQQGRRRVIDDCLHADFKVLMNVRKLLEKIHGVHTLLWQAWKSKSPRSWPTTESLARNPLPIARTWPLFVDVCLQDSINNALDDTDVDSYSMGNDHDNPIGRTAESSELRNSESDSTASIFSAIQSKNALPSMFLTVSSIRKLRILDIHMELLVEAWPFNSTSATRKLVPPTSSARYVPCSFPLGRVWLNEGNMQAVLDWSFARNCSCSSVDMAMRLC